MTALDDGGRARSGRARRTQARAELEALVRIPSISADPARRADVRASAEATAELLRAARPRERCGSPASTARTRT